MKTLLIVSNDRIQQMYYISFMTITNSFSNAVSEFDIDFNINESINEGVSRL